MTVVGPLGGASHSQTKALCVVFSLFPHCFITAPGHILPSWDVVETKTVRESEKCGKYLRQQSRLLRSPL